MFSFIKNITWQTKLVFMIAVAVVSFSAGWRVHGWKTDAAVVHAVAKQEKTRQLLQQDQATIIAKGDEQEKSDRKQFVNIREKINDQNDQSICFNAESLKLWNDAIGANQDSYRREPIIEAGTADAAQGEASEQSNAEVVATVEQVLSNAADNFEICTRNSNKHLQLIEAVRAINDKMCVCN